jgi:hypothetical protein
MAPEQFRGQAFLSTDLYGLATTLTINIPPVKFWTTSSQQLALLAVVMNFILAVSIYFITTISFSIEPSRLDLFII